MKPRTKQRTLAMANGFERYTKKTRRAAFLEEMEQVVPWSELCSLVEPHYPKAGNGRRPVGIERMLRIYFLQQWFNLSDPAVEEALYDSPLMRDTALPPRKWRRPRSLPRLQREDRGSQVRNSYAERCWDTGVVM